jgi:hypothetical protein
MVEDRPQADRILVARLSGAAGRLSRWGALDDAQAVAAAAELRELAGGRGDLLAEVAGIRLGTSEHKGAEYVHQAAAIARLCRAAGADLEAIGEWTEEGRRRAAAARRPSPGGGARPALRAETRSHRGHGQITGRRRVRTHRAPPPLLPRLPIGSAAPAPRRGGKP